MFKRYAKGFSEKEVQPFSSPLQEDLSPLFSEKHFSPLPEEILNTEAETLLGKDLHIKGELSFGNLLRVDGSFEGTLLSEGKLIVGPTGFVKSDLSLKEADIAGKVEGSITVQGNLTLRATAEVQGDITANTIVIEKGAILFGQVNISRSSSATPEEDLY